MNPRVLGAELGVIRQTLALLTRAERRRFALLLPPMLVVALFEVAGVASLAPFLALLADPDRYARHPVLRLIHDTFGFQTPESLFFFVGASILALLTIGNTLAALTMWGLLRFSWGRNTSLSTRLLANYLYRPYPFFLERSTADLVGKALTDARDVAVHVIWQSASLAARLAVIVFITAGLVYIDPMLAAGAVLVFGGLYGALFVVSRRWAIRSGKQRMEAEAARLRISMDALNGAKEVKLYRLEETVLSAFSGVSQRSSRSAANQVIVSILPRYALETVAFGGVLVMVLYLLAMHRPLEGTLPILGLYAFATVRLLPALQAVFTALSSLRFYSSTVGVLGRELENAPPRRGREATVALGFEREVRLVDVSFSYAGAGKPVLERVSLSLGAGEWVVFVGPTGSGKSTLVDLMLGLLEPTSGVIEVDGTPLTPETARAWQMLAGYVPQQIFLIDDTIEANICFGVEKAAVDRERLEHVAGLAQIHDFVTKELPDGYQTVVGDRGVRLSGGQRQRLGIARALYRAPRFLVLDEATSALDGATEAAFFEALRRDLAGCTVVSITHRKSTARSFDRAYVLEGGVITAEPDPRELAAQASA